MDFGERVKKAIDHSGKLQREVAEDSGLSEATLRNWKRRDDLPARHGRVSRKTKKSVEDVATACGVRPDWLLNDDGEMERNGEMEGNAARSNPHVSDETSLSYSSHHRTGRVVSVPVLAVERPGTVDRHMTIDEDAFAPLPADDIIVMRVVGSQAEPWVSHGQNVILEPTSRVQGEDLYAYYSYDDSAHLLAWMRKEGDTLHREIASGADTLTPHDEDNTYTTSDGTVIRMSIVARVVGTVARVGKQRAREERQAQLQGKVLAEALRDLIT